MKKAERDQARELRRQGLSLGEIRRQLGVAKSSVSLWVRDIELTPEQLERLSARQANWYSQAPRLLSSSRPSNRVRRWKSWKATRASPQR